ncbi:Excinuclease ABC subunit C [Luteitalea pratensis]|uniref:UvrABC system protein C n=1 Tax=Luteitalea pratensis TaxID=1855912 RepID=A0A143PTZ8_LUTPR|nr:excinuclease ABC subunit UvrC [Luteitalea pratensis]AMY11274.1 Excinuclease ABC subunit C [Luteitalea pratensis]
MAIEDLKTQIARLPEQPGVYLYCNPAGETIYVGKARALRDRVRSYLGARGSSPKTEALLDEVTSLDVIVTDSVVEALALENNLIKERSPKYNIKLRDDKTYPYLRLSTSEGFPRVTVVRRVANDGDYYAGPFMPASLAWQTRSLSHKLFGIRSCREVITGQRGRPCLEYDIKRCLAPCVAAICSQADYQHAVRDARLLLDGRTEELVADLESRMQAAADEQRYEQAAQLRDTIRTLETLRDRQQKMATPRMGDRDAIGVKLGPGGAVVQVFQVRSGRVVDRVEMVTNADQARDARLDELLERAVTHAYTEQAPPPEVLLPIALPDMDLLAEWLSARAGRQVLVSVPQRGDKKALLELAERNASLSYAARFNAEGAANYEALETLQAALGLAALPRRIDCFDISTLQGAETVASMVVCQDGRMKRSEYRKYRIRAESGSRESGVGNRAAGRIVPVPEVVAGIVGTSDFATQGPREAGPEGGLPGGRYPEPGARFLDDFAAMTQVVTRRYRKVADEDGPWPDLIVIDGGKGQLNAAYDALEALGLDHLVAVGLAKQEELVFTRDREDPIAFGDGTPALRMLQRIRDEAHRFAVTFHRAARANRDLRSELDEVTQIGPRRRRQLLTTFGSVAGVRRASREELTTVVGAKAADAVLRHFASGA